jgi:DNA-binding TFAR19-related protein (PDSD5 family)
MTDLQEREARYRRLFGRITPDEARNLVDRLQVLALTRPDTVRELETFFERDDARSSRAAASAEDHPNP